ncbi:MAG: MBL fold metallo-hydrolase, partial [Flavitalea sp.]
MSLFITSLNSGSNGNCYYIGNREEGVLVDVGLSCREVEKRMNRLGLPVRNIKAIFISHEHADHISGLSVMSKKYQLPVYITEKTSRNCPVQVEKKLIVGFRPYTTVYVGQLGITAFPKSHDASDPHSFIIKYNSVCVGIFTDIGVVCDNLVHHFKECNAAFLEANYDEA